MPNPGIGLPPRARLREPAVNGAEHSEPIATVPSDDPIPEVLRRCDHCGQPATVADPLSPYNWQGRPDGIRLHQRCEALWFDSHKPAARTNGARHQATTTEKQPDAVADVPDQT